MRSVFDTSDYGVSCCVSGLALGRDTQYFGARCNLPKLLLYAINDGVDERSGKRVAPRFRDLAAKTGEAPSGAGSDSLEGSDDHRLFLAEPLDFSVVWSRFERYCSGSRRRTCRRERDSSRTTSTVTGAPDGAVDTRPRRVHDVGVETGRRRRQQARSSTAKRTPVLTDEAICPPFAVGFESVGVFSAYGVDTTAPTASSTWSGSSTGIVAAIEPGSTATASRRSRCSPSPLT